MRAVVYEGVGKVAVAEVADPELVHPDDAIVRVRLAAICGSDLHFLHGKAPLEPGEPIGHEAVGVVEAVGPDVRRFRTGDRVAVSFVIACGACWFCGRGQTQLCEDFRNLGAGIFGGGLGGAQAELLRVPHADVNLLALPEELEDERAIFLGDVLTTGVYAAGVAGVEPGEAVAVVGAGPVGFFAAQAARARGADPVLVLDTLPDRLALAERVGAEPVDVSRRSPQMAVARRTGDRGADVVIEAVGHPSAFETALDIVRRGGRVAVVGMYAGEQVSAPLGVWWARALDVRFAGICPVHAWWERAMEDLRAGRIDPTPLVSHRLPLEEAPKGYELFDARRATKVLLVP
ncbi:MAG: glutathione-dependent formaldehyde dehydrogenase [Actinomycetota bacterium]|nr:MAG: glutathione-dependent formaldehyde dehydrogenase [Actinomycetota bacterium]